MKCALCNVSLYELSAVRHSVVRIASCATFACMKCELCGGLDCVAPLRWSARPRPLVGRRPSPHARRARLEALWSPPHRPGGRIGPHTVAFIQGKAAYRALLASGGSRRRMKCTVCGIWPYGSHGVRLVAARRARFVVSRAQSTRFEGFACAMCTVCGGARRRAAGPNP